MSDAGLVFEVRGLVKTYPRQRRPANDGIDLDVRQGDVLGLLGDNGAGKTTLVQQLVGLLRPTAGTVRLRGRDVRSDPAFVARHVGYMPQSAFALNQLTVREALYFTAHLRGLPARTARAERDRLMEVWDLTDVAGRVASRLSGGQRRRLQLAVTLAGRPPVVVLDEPTNDLAPQRRRHVWETLRALNAEEGMTVVLITHDAVEAERVVRRVAMMRDGRIVAEGSPPALKRALRRPLRLELFFPPAEPPDVPEALPRYVLEPGRWVLELDVDDVAPVLGRLDLDRLEDLRLQSATLEDLYLHHMAQGPARPAGGRDG